MIHLLEEVATEGRSTALVESLLPDRCICVRSHMLLLLALLVTTLSLETGSPCPKPWATQEDADGVWEAYDYPNDSFLLFRIRPDQGPSSLTMVSGPPHSARIRRLTIEKALVEEGRLMLLAGDQRLSVTVSGCLVAGDGWGILRRGLLTVGGAGDPSPAEVAIELVKGPYQRRRGAYRDIAARSAEKPLDNESEPRHVPYSEIPEKDRILELPTDVLVNPKKLNELGKKYGVRGRSKPVQPINK